MFPQSQIIFVYVDFSPAITLFFPLQTSKRLAHKLVQKGNKLYITMTNKAVLMFQTDE